MYDDRRLTTIWMCSFENPMPNVDCICVSMFHCLIEAAAGVDVDIQMVCFTSPPLCVIVTSFFFCFCFFFTLATDIQILIAQLVVSCVKPSHPKSTYSYDVPTHNSLQTFWTFLRWRTHRYPEPMSKIFRKKRRKNPTPYLYVSQFHTPKLRNNFSIECVSR